MIVKLMKKDMGTLCHGKLKLDLFFVIENLFNFKVVHALQNKSNFS